MDRDLHVPRRTLPERIVSHVRRDVPLLILDIAAVFVAYTLTLVLRFEGLVPPRFWRSLWTFLPLAAFMHVATNHVFGLYGQMWRYASVREARQVVLAGGAGGGLVVSAVALMNFGTRLVPLSVAIVGAVFSLLAFGAVRFQSRLFAFRRHSIIHRRVRVLLVGAGDAGAMVLKDILQNSSLGLDPVGVIDDDSRKVGRALHGIPVMGRRADIPPLVARHQVDQVLLAIPSATSEVVRDVAALCEEADVMLRVVPSVREIVGGRVTARDIRDLSIEDLLGRQQVELDLEAISDLLRGHRVLVTGAGGSIGSEIARQVAEFEPSALTLLDHDETHLHDVFQELDDPAAKVVLADIRDHDRIHEIFAQARPEVVFHAAAHKHVPLLEIHPEEAVFTNVMGTANVTDAALAAGVARFVMISTDKAVRPSSVMGASKWFGEQLVRSVQERGCAFCAVRFGNVLGSRGSVIPTFLRQIERGGPVTVTDPSMARYFMSIREAVQLVLQAATLSHGGEVLTLRMGEPVNVMGLARKLIRLSGRVPDKDVPIEVVGARPGEKLVEDIVDPLEEPAPSSHPAVVVSRPPVPDRPALRRALRELEALAATGAGEALSALLKSLAGSDAHSAISEGGR